MSWLKVDDGFTGHPKLDRLLDDPGRWARALAVWLAAGCYAAKYATNGRVTALRVSRECAAGVDVGEAFADLERCGLLDRDGDAWVLHNFTRYNPTRDERDRAREQNRERQKRHRSKKLRPSSHGSVTPERNAGVTALRDAVGNAAPDPTRPDPVTPTGGVSDLQPDGVDLLGQPVKSRASSRWAVIASLVCGWVATHQNRRPRSTSKSMVALGRSLASMRPPATDLEIHQALELKAAEWARDENEKYWGKPETIARVLPRAVESVRTGAKPADFQPKHAGGPRDVRVGYGQPMTHAEAAAAAAAGERF